MTSKNSETIKEVDGKPSDKDIMSVGSIVLGMSDFIADSIPRQSQGGPLADLPYLIAITSAMMLATYAEESGFNDLVFEQVSALKKPGVDTDPPDGRSSGQEPVSGPGSSPDEIKATWVISVKKQANSS